MQLEEKHFKALNEAEALIFHSDFCPYLELKELLGDESQRARDRFRILFTKYYALNTGGLTRQFKERFFDVLFSNQVVVKGQPAFKSILSGLSRFKRRTGDQAIPYSFVSKLVSMHRETSPICDIHVLNFFREKRPATSGTRTQRIKWFIGFLAVVARSYQAWATDKRIKAILKRLKARDPRLARCHDVRLLDFLVWKVGNQKLLVKTNS